MKRFLLVFDDGNGDEIDLTRFVRFAGSRIFFVSDFSRSEDSGRLPGLFWDDFVQANLKTSAE